MMRQNTNRRPEIATVWGWRAQSHHHSVN